MLVNKKCAFSFFLKLLVFVVDLKSLRRQFHSAGPANENARSANFVRSRGLERNYNCYLLNADRVADNYPLTCRPVQLGMTGIVQHESGALLVSVVCVVRSWCFRLSVRITPRTRSHRFLPQLPVVSTMHYNADLLAGQQTALVRSADLHLLCCRWKHWDGIWEILQVNSWFHFRFLELWVLCMVPILFPKKFPWPRDVAQQCTIFYFYIITTLCPIKNTPKLFW